MKTLNGWTSVQLGFFWFKTFDEYNEARTCTIHTIICTRVDNQVIHIIA